MKDIQTARHEDITTYTKNERTHADRKKTLKHKRKKDNTQEIQTDRQTHRHA